MVSPCCPKDMLTVLSRICPQVLTVAAAVEAAVEAEEEEWEGAWGMGMTSCSVC